MMKNVRFTPLKNIFFWICGITLTCPVHSNAADIRIGGTGNALGTMKLMAKAYNRIHPKDKVIVLESLGSSGGIRAVSKGAIDIGLSSRPLDDHEKQIGLRAIEYARAPTVFAVNLQNKRTNITVQEILAIYAGTLRHWEDGTLIRPILRQSGEDNTKQVIQLAPQMKSALKKAETRPGIPYAVTDQDTANKMEQIPGSLGVTTLPLIRSENRALRALSLGGVEPTPENTCAGRYPMLKYFLYVLPKEPSSAAMKFIGFLNSPQGQAILRRNGHCPPVSLSP